MDLEQLKQILDLVRAHELSEFEIEQEGLRLKIRKDAAGCRRSSCTCSRAAGVRRACRGRVPAGATPSGARRAADGPSRSRSRRTSTPTSSSPSSSRRSSAPSIDRRSRARRRSSDVGTAVKKGQVLCVIEAMKLMNEIDSEYDGEIVNVYVENGQPVQYGERLFAIRTKV